MSDQDKSVSSEPENGLVMGKIADLDIDMMRRRIGYPNPTLRKGFQQKPWNVYCTQDAIRRFAECTGDMNPLFNDEDYPKQTRWGEAIAPPGFEWSMGIDKSPVCPDDLFNETRRALRGVQLYHSGAEYFYYRPIRDGLKLYKNEVVGGVEEKQSRFATRSVIVDNVSDWWDDDGTVYVRNSRWFVHAERRKLAARRPSDAAPREEPHTRYTDAQLADIEALYDNEYLRGKDTLYLEDVETGEQLPDMVKGPLTITDMINLHMGAGWLTYGNPPYRLAYENRKLLRGFYSRNEFGAWDTIQRVHWDVDLAHEIGVKHTYDIGPMRFGWLCHYLSSYAGDDGWVYRIRYELRNFNYMGDTTWISGKIVGKRIDETLGPIIEVEVKGVNQRGEENITAQATLLVASRDTGLAELPPLPTLTAYRREE